MYLRLSHLCLAVALLASLPSSARAQVCGNAVALRVNQGGLDFVAQQVGEVIPSQIAIPDVDKVVVDWPLTDKDARVQIHGLAANLKLHTLRLYIRGSAIHVSVRADVQSP